jgi:hypothetical protein
MDRHKILTGLRTAPTDRTAVGDVKPHRAPPRAGAHPLPAADAATQLGAQANGIEPAEFQESS